MMRIARFFYRTLKGIYDILATYLLAWILFFAALSVLFHFGLGGRRATLILERVAANIGMSSVLLRLVVFGTLHGLAVLLLHRQLAAGQALLERYFDALTTPIKNRLTHYPRLRLILESLFTLMVTAALIPFLLQPTLVAGFDRQSWLERGANLLDGTTTVMAADSIIGFYRLLGAEPQSVAPLSQEEATLAFSIEISQTSVERPISSIDRRDRPDRPAKPRPTFAELWEEEQKKNPPGPNQSMETTSPPTGVPPKTLPLSPTGKEPMMDRWDDHIERAAKNDRHRFAQIKAFMYVESAGRQFAVSPTGCSGLMQFCAPTARDRHHRSIFGTGQVYVCRCRGRCSIDRATQRSLETGDLAAADKPGAFPCEITDARFDAQKSIRAGAAFIDRLHRSYGGNLYLMYIGYNSGPAVADNLWRRIGNDPDVDLATIRLHLPDAMRPYYGQGSQARSNSLVNTHLPKLQRAFDRYYASAPASPGR